MLASHTDGQCRKSEQEVDGRVEGKGCKVSLRRSISPLSAAHSLPSPARRASHQTCLCRRCSLCAARGETQTKHPVQNGQRQGHRWRDKNICSEDIPGFSSRLLQTVYPVSTELLQELSQDRIRHPAKGLWVSGDAIRRGHSTNRFHANNINKSRSKKPFSGGEWCSLLCTSLAGVTCLAVTSWGCWGKYLGYYFLGQTTLTITACNQELCFYKKKTKKTKHKTSCVSAYTVT